MDGSLKAIQIITLLLLVEAAVLCDLFRGRIPNGLILAGVGMGLVYQAVLGGIAGLIVCLGGLLLPVLLFSPLYYFRMIGAGDIKLLGVLGAFMGPWDGLSCTVWALAAGAVFSLLKMFRDHTFAYRLFFLAEYFEKYSRTGLWRPYLEEADDQAKFCFSVPVLLSVLGYIVRVL